MPQQQPHIATTQESSQRLNQFLKAEHLHKKDFAEMIGVTLSYVYNLLDETLPFPSRHSTLERIAMVMETPASTFSEYRDLEVPLESDPGVAFLKTRQQALGLSNVQFLKKFPRKQRRDVVDLWRGALPLPLDWSRLRYMGSILCIESKALYPFWQARLQQQLLAGGLEPLANIGLLNAIFQGAEGYVCRTTNEF